MRDPADPEWRWSDPRVLGSAARIEIEARVALAEHHLNRVRYPDLPPASECHLPAAAPAEYAMAAGPSPGIASPLLEEARRLSLYPDFKSLSDLRRRTRAPTEYGQWQATFDELLALPANDVPTQRADLLRRYIDWAFEVEPGFSHGADRLIAPGFRLEHPDASVRAAFDYVESTWTLLVRTAAGASGSSLLGMPFPFLVPAGRFRESYYWDTCFGIDGLLATRRNEICRMQADNLLDLIRRFGFVPNGNRDYYLSRSQVPLSATLVRKVVIASDREWQLAGDTLRLERLRRWVRIRALPLLAREFIDFWSEPSTRFDQRTGLHHHWDAVDARRPERHSRDAEDTLGLTYRDLRASAESGLDFTEVDRGPSGRIESSRIASVLLNAVLCRFARDLAWLADYVGDRAVQTRFMELGTARSRAMEDHLWDEASGTYRNRHLDAGTLAPDLGFATFAPLFAGACAPERAARVRNSLPILERPGGVAASSLWTSPHQWDGSKGWAPAQMITIEGLLHYGYRTDARRLGEKWLTRLGTTYARFGHLLERVDLDGDDLPGKDRDQYPVQEGFLWTNSSLVWAATEVLGYQMVPIGERTAA